MGSIGPHQSGLMLTERPNSTLDDKEDRSARWGKQKDGVAARRAGIGGKERRRSGMQMRCLNAVPLCHAQSVAGGPRQDRGGSSNSVHRGENRGDLGGGRLAGDVDGGAALGRSGGSGEREGGRWCCVRDRSSLEGSPLLGSGANTRRSARHRDLAAPDSLRATAGERNGGRSGGSEEREGGRWRYVSERSSLDRATPDRSGANTRRRLGIAILQHRTV